MPTAPGSAPLRLPETDKGGNASTQGTLFSVYEKGEDLSVAQICRLPGEAEASNGWDWVKLGIPEVLLLSYVLGQQAEYLMALSWFPSLENGHDT